MAEWEGQSRGNLLGYKIFIFLLRKLGIGVAYFVLRFVAFYYFLFSFKSSKCIYQYFHKRLGYSPVKSILNIYSSYYTLGRILIDRVAISTGLREKFTYTHDGIKYIDDLLKEGQGGILISGHVGNFEIAHYFLENRYNINKISMVTTRDEQQSILDYMDSIVVKSQLDFILVKDDMSHIFEIHSALDKGGLVVFTGDRYLPGTKTLKASLLGKEAEFPLGPYLLASRLNMPVLFVYVMKETRKHYSLYARKANFKARDAQGLLNEYTQSMEWIIKKYPLQWFNFFDFWKDLKKE
ncbi:lipid A biosynthesis acyltransferase [Euzebyella marina]|uniref:Lipid A biosynthesis acyltransferase n=1 Tax=Euzebyella marina TaxID=1761453 RepID=A0A3G2LAU1_9FLAO|nr:lipid A biosynthesis acyltransferase [Euzebyella marina]AYN69321.1 lipid A biosynthesis acyltransferase [Euzebyella marina]MAU71598.1 lipid A biosynthesis acyltransferase [Pseudozobellia sp.]MBG47916.1 lipid A biosynthesis acyltransferase [Pseudozobellia sp.]|tara:strand:- start:124 stop:1008 length:885 start_codon:yes stop_codon:yes gene_type:complete